MENSGQVSSTNIPNPNPAPDAPVTPIVDAPKVEAPATETITAMHNVTSPQDVRIEMLLEECIKRKASDLHIQVGLPPILRIDGLLIPITDYPILDEEAIEHLIFATLDSEQRHVLTQDKEFDYSFAFGEAARFRVNSFHEKGNLAALR